MIRSGKNSHLSNALKVLWILSLWLLIAGVVLLASNPSTGYEASIYTAVSLFTWIALGACVLGGLLSAIWAAVDERMSDTGAWAAGFGIVTAVAVVTMLAPVLRGYTGYGRSDILVHAGRVIDIQLYGHIPEYDRPSSMLMYPASHILLAQISQITGLAPFATVQYTALAMYLLGVLFTYLLATMIARHSLEMTLCMLASSVLLLSSMNYQVLPTALGYSILPLVLYAYMRVVARNSPVHRFVFILISVIYPFIHPLACISLLLGLAVMEAYVSTRRTKPSDRRSITNVPSASILAGTLGISILIILITLATWLWYNWYYWRLAIRELINLVTDFGHGGYEKAIGEVEQAGIGMFDAILLLLKMHGHHMLYFLLTAISSIVILGAAGRDHNSQIRKLMRIVMFLVAQVFALALFLFGGSRTVSYWRALAPILLTVPVLLGYLGYHGCRRHIQKPGVLVGATILLFLVFEIGVFSFFPSPYTQRLNQQVSSAELRGVGWLDEHKNKMIPVHSLALKHVFVAGLRGFKIVEQCDKPDDPKWGESPAPSHFDYTLDDETDGASSVYYLPVHVQDRLYYALLPRNPERFLQSDFDNLSEASYIDKVYANGELDLWVVHAGDVLEAVVSEH